MHTLYYTRSHQPQAATMADLAEDMAGPVPVAICTEKATYLGVTTATYVLSAPWRGYTVLNVTFDAPACELEVPGAYLGEKDQVRTHSLEEGMAALGFIVVLE